MNYPLRDFIGPYLPASDENVKPKGKLHHITIYLAPGTTQNINWSPLYF